MARGSRCRRAKRPQPLSRPSVRFTRDARRFPYTPFSAHRLPHTHSLSALRRSARPHRYLKSERTPYHESNRNRQADRRPRTGRHPQGNSPHHADTRGRPDTDIIDTRYPILVRNHGYFQKIWSGSRGLIHHAEGRKPPPKSQIAVSIEAAILHTSRGKLCTAVS